MHNKKIKIKINPVVTQATYMAEREREREERDRKRQIKDRFNEKEKTDKKNLTLFNLQ